VRIWLSGPRILGGLVRPGISLGPEDMRHLGGRPARLPSYRRYELRAGLQEAAKARGDKLTKEDCNYAIDKALATGLLDKDGNLNFIAKGTRDEMAEQILAAATTWGKPMTHAEAAGRPNPCAGFMFAGQPIEQDCSYAGLRIELYLHNRFFRPARV